MDKFLIVVADGGIAKLFNAKKIGGKMNFLEKFENKNARYTDSELTSDKYGDHKSHLGNSSNEQKSDPKEIEEAKFAKDLVKILDKKKHSFEKLVLIAPPRFMHDLRKELTPDMQRHVAFELVKDYTHLSTEEIEQDLESNRP